MADRQVQQEAQEKVDRVKEADAPEIYVNGFSCGITNSDIQIIGERSGEPVVSLYVSYTMAKTLAHALVNMVSTLEEVTGRDMLTTHDIDKALELKKKS